MADPHGLPGADRIVRGLSDLAAARMSPEALLVRIAASRLRALGFAVAELAPESTDVELQLYEALGRRAGPHDDPYYQLNSWLRELSSFLEAAEARARR